MLLFFKTLPIRLSEKTGGTILAGQISVRYAGWTDLPVKGNRQGVIADCRLPLTYLPGGHLTFRAVFFMTGLRFECSIENFAARIPDFTRERSAIELFYGVVSPNPR